jgi:hypothetical protein
VPAAPVAGATLYANAQDLRPLIDGAAWQYRGVKNSADGSTITRYTSSVRQKLVGDTLQETEDLVFLEDGESSAITLSSGRIIVQVRDPLGIGTSEVVALTELRSPVRVNDQYTLLERNDVPTGVDIDSDGKADHADFAVYSRVIGNESVQLPELARTLSAVKIETTALVRYRKSSTGDSSPVSSLVQTLWYVAGVGPVRRSLSAISTSGSVGPLVYDELLFSWDGVTQGLGALGPTAATVPNRPGLSLLPDTLAATTLGDRALVLTGSLQASDPTAMAFGVFDKRGTLKSVAQAPGLGGTGNIFGTPSLFSLDTSTALLVMPAEASPGKLKLQRVDAEGSLLGGPSLVSLPTYNFNLPVAWDGRALWIAWLSTASLPADNGKLMLQPFGPDGLALAAPQLLDTPSMSGTIGGVRMSAAAGRLLVSWDHTVPASVSYRYALVRDIGEIADVRTLGSVQRFTSPQPAVVPVLGSGIAALYWTGPVFSFTNSGPMPETLLRGVLLDAGANPLRSTSTNLDNEMLPASWIGNSESVLAQAIGDRLFVGSFAYQRAAPYLGHPSDFILASIVKPGSSPLATAAASPTSATSMAAISGTLTNIDQFGRPAFVLLWDDRALIIGNNGGRTMTSLFWLK